MGFPLATEIFGGAFTPHGFCLAWEPAVLRLHVASDGLIALAYYSIPLSLGTLVLRRRDLVFGWAFVLFATFILACGTTHVLEIWTLWHADYMASGVLKAFTAAVSVATAASMWPLIPRILALPSPAALRQSNTRLAEQIEETEAALAALRREAAQREQAEAMLRHSQRLQAIGELTGGIAHDFNNLLMVVQGNLEVLAIRLRGQAELRRYVDRAAAAVARGGALTRQLLAFAGRQPLTTTIFDVNQRVRALTLLLPGTLGERVRLDLRLSAAVGEAELDATQFDSALLNLAINAGHAMPDGGTLTIETTPREVDLATSAALDVLPGRFVQVTVADTGTGMTPEVLEKAFEPFFTTRAANAGSGLGLSQVYGFIKQSRGHVSLRSAPGLGCQVTLLLPARPPARHAAAVSGNEPDNRRTGSSEGGLADQAD